jgi:PEP-CTERM motif
LNIQVGDTVNARLNFDRVDPKVGGITISVDGETYGGSTADHNIGTDAFWAGCYLFDIENMATAYKSFCMDATTGVTMIYTQHTAYSATAAMESMWGTYYDDVIGNAQTAAAFQLAMWELVHETATPNDIETGNFHLVSLLTTSTNNNGATFSGLVSLANGYLDSTSWTETADLVLLDDGSHQPFLVEVPEPSTIAMLIIGLLSLGSMKLIRRKR